jgi:branched-chain amino acid transport system ATP-binding protein
VTAILETRGVGRRFGGVAALQDVSVQVEEGEIVGVIGPNGAGKTTFINVVTGFLRPTAGRVLIDGKDLTRAKPWEVARARVARTFQIVKPFREMTARENVAMGFLFGPDGGASPRQGLAEADEVLERVGLGAKAQAPAAELSVAEAKRLELARALAMRPRLLLLDEVMAGLRPTEIEDAVDLVRTLRKEAITIVAVEHVMRAILAVSDRVVVLHEGRVLTSGSPDEVASDDRVIEAYLGQRYAQRLREEGRRLSGGPAEDRPDA